MNVVDVVVEYLENTNEDFMAVFGNNLEFGITCILFGLARLFTFSNNIIRASKT